MLQARIPMVTPEEQRSIRGGEEGAASAAEIYPTPTEDDICAMREALGDDPTFAGLPEAGKAAFFRGMLGMKWVAGIYDDVGEQYQNVKLAKSARELQKLKAVIRLFDDYTDTHLVQALGEMRRRHQLTWPGMFKASLIFLGFANVLVECGESELHDRRVWLKEGRPRRERT
jgi:hypothetical protein